MHARIILLTIFAALAASVTAVAAPSATGPTIVGNFTYGEASALGVATLLMPSQLGLPMCLPDPTWRGFRSPEDAEAAIQMAGGDDRGPDCAVDPRNVIYSVRGPFDARPAPYQAGGPATYRHLGALTEDFNYSGATITVEVSNPTVGHPVAEGYEFVASRPLLTNGADWIDGGWAEVSWMNDARYVYTYLGSGLEWYFYPDFPLADGSYYIFRMHSIFVGGGPYAEIWWDGMWMVLHQSPTMESCQNVGGCRVEEFTEAYSDRYVWPVFNAPVDGSGINHSSTKLTDPYGKWVYWNDSLYPSTEPGLTPGTPNTAPYNPCFADRDWNFRAVQGQC